MFDVDFLSGQFQVLDNGLMLTNHEIEILDKYNITYKNCSTLKEILYYIDKILEVQEDSLLEEISISISERDYYQNTNK